MSKSTHKLKEIFVGANCVRPHFEGITKKENGITLIALIITIIVMLILTGVTLSITLGDNGLVNKAKEASEEMQLAMDRELLLSAAIGAMGNDGKVNLSVMVLPEGFTGSNGTYTSKNGNTFTVSENGEITVAGNGNVGGDITENGSEDVEVNLDGMYWYTYDQEPYFGIMDGEFYGWTEEACPITAIDEENKTMTFTFKDEILDESNKVIGYETYYQTVEYDLIIENSEIVNKILILREGDYSFITQTSTKGYELGTIDGIYMVQGSETERYVFEAENSTYRRENKTGDVWGGGSSTQDELYFKYKGQYFMRGESVNLEISNDGNTIVIKGSGKDEDIVLIKQTAE